MAVYYYIAASLPMLLGPDQPPPIESGVLLDSCRLFMNDEDYAGIENATTNPEDPEAPGICRIFRAWEKSLRNDLVRLRAAEQSLEPAGYLREAETVFGTASVASAAMNASTPLEAELLLNKARWSVLDELESGHYYDIEFLRSYRMKLQILERRAKFDEERGFEAYQDIYARVLEASGGTN